LAYWDSQWRIRTPDHLRSEELRHVPPAIVEWQGKESPDPSASAQWRRALGAAQKYVGLLLERGVPVFVGTDVPCGAVPPGLSLWRELSLLVEAGMSPEQALCAATSDAATFLGRDKLGRLSRDAAADMVFVRGNPMQQIPDRPDIVKVVRGGVVYRPEELLAAAATAALTLTEDPWAIQFAIHRARRMEAQSSHREP